MTQIALLFLEAIDGAAIRAHVVFGVILGTDVALALTARSYCRTQQDPPENGAITLCRGLPKASGRPPCDCGDSGCVETCLSGAGPARDYHSRTGQHLTAKEISLAASGGDEYAQQSLTVYQDRLARGLAVVINLLDPDVIVLGGGLSNIGQLYAGLSALVGIYTFSDGIDTPIVRAAHGDFRAECVVRPGVGRPVTPT